MIPRWSRVAPVRQLPAAPAGPGPEPGRRRRRRRRPARAKLKHIKCLRRAETVARVLLQFNFVGKLLGPKGNSLKRLQEDTLCKMAVLGRGSMKDRQKEEELRVSGDPKFSHLADDLHVEVSAFATPAEAHARVAYALAELRRFLVPDYNDDIRQEQMLEMQLLAQAPRSPPSPAPLAPPAPPAPPAGPHDPDKHRAGACAASSLPAGMGAGVGGRDYSPPLPAPAPAPVPDHAHHHQLAASHGVLMGGVLPPHHLLHGSILGDYMLPPLPACVCVCVCVLTRVCAGGGELLRLGSPVLRGVLRPAPAPAPAAQGRYVAFTYSPMHPPPSPARMPHPAAALSQAVPDTIGSRCPQTHCADLYTLRRIDSFIPVGPAAYSINRARGSTIRLRLHYGGHERSGEERRRRDRPITTRLMIKMRRREMRFQLI
ncbi:hypothetical protein MSG28_013919 [Choristoneura fumiferana]|uniref:Uncharacterized protein n=1 Tax=Choristoneura fumiferana TaxID=7141 RepID=A0ACC0K979_CHOFU|nr:hypothetical protein MSG28_013919 [Choristoneura fumiferana]